MLLWLEQRLHLKVFFTRPCILRGFTFWTYLPGIFAIILFLIQTITGFYILYQHQMTGISEISLFLQNLHRFSTNLLLFCIFLYIIHLFFLGIYRYLGELIWFCAWILLGLSALSIMTCYSIENNPSKKTNALLSQEQALTKIEVVYNHYKSIPIWNKLFALENKTPEQLQKACYALHLGVLPFTMLFFLLTFINSTSKIRVELGRICSPAPLEP